jgi:hypothetical protein
MNKENEIHIYSGVLFSHEEQNFVICQRVDGTGDHHAKQNKPDSEKQIYVFPQMQNLDLKNKT